MELAPLPLNSTMARRIRESGTEGTDYWDLVIEAEARIDMLRVYFAHHGAEQNYRPYLHGIGQVRSLQGLEREDGTRETAVFGYDVDELSFASDKAPSADMFYEFSDEQLTELVRRGYFHHGYQAPADLETVYELPVRVDVLLAAPEFEGDHPLVFAEVQKLNELVMSEQISGYDLLEKMPDKSVQDQVQEVRDHSETEYVSGPVNDLFADQDFTVETTEQGVRVPRKEEKVESRFERDFREFEGSLNPVDLDLARQADVADDDISSAIDAEVDRHTEEIQAHHQAASVDQDERDEQGSADEHRSERNSEHESNDRVDADDSLRAKNAARREAARETTEQFEENVHHQNEHHEEIDFIDLNTEPEEQTPTRVMPPKLRTKSSREDPKKLIEFMQEQQAARGRQAERQQRESEGLE